MTLSTVVTYKYTSISDTNYKSSVTIIIVIVIARNNNDNNNDNNNTFIIKIYTYAYARQWKVDLVVHVHCYDKKCQNIIYIL